MAQDAAPWGYYVTFDEEGNEIPEDEPNQRHNVPIVTCGIVFGTVFVAILLIGYIQMCFWH